MTIDEGEEAITVGPSPSSTSSTEVLMQEATEERVDVPTEVASVASPTRDVVASATPLATAPSEAMRATDTPAPTPTVTMAPPFDASTISVALEPVASGFRGPLGVVNAGDGTGRLFVVEKGGRIMIVQEGGDVLPTPFLDISTLVSTGSEQGLLGFAFEPGRPERFYINYTDRAGNSVIARYRVGEDPNVADPSSEEVLLKLEQPAANHNGGHLLFGPDGYLWIGMGDGGAAGDRFGNAQNAETLLGAMLRLDVRGETGYAIPPDNPFVDGAQGSPEIWAIGLRNPWRYSFDRMTGDLWVADVGQQQWEEVNHVSSDVPALNYGWPILEGSHCYQTANCSREGLVVPVTEYDHSQGISVTGGYVYRGSEFPELQGGYFFSDYGSGLLWAIPADVQSLIEPTIVLDTGLNVSSFGEDEEGELYLTDIAGGTLYQVVSR
ncbi:MAG: PQQ-dependent sugar dehydrogenase [Chloroflexota bacterium]|nr:PQQ-dependent sugar dehydrogenase [Chloroflexota bacterium]